MGEIDSGGFASVPQKHIRKKAEKIVCGEKNKQKGLRSVRKTVRGKKERRPVENQGGGHGRRGQRR